MTEQGIHKTMPAPIMLKKIEEQTKKKRKSYTKNQIAIDTITQVILAQKVARGPRHDSKDAIPTIRKTRKYKPVGFQFRQSV